MMADMERMLLLSLEDEGERIEVMMSLTEDDLLDIGMLRTDSVHWTGTRVVELIDWRHDDREWHEKKDWA